MGSLSIFLTVAFAGEPGGSHLSFLLFFAACLIDSAAARREQWLWMI
jgi:hypothetical protein